MKKSSVLISAFLLLFCIKVQAQTGSEAGYTINGSINGVSSGVVKLLPGNGNTTTDSATITDGKFTMKGKAASPELRAFIVTPGKWTFQALVENADINLGIDTTGAERSAYTDNYGMIRGVKESGSPINDVYTQFKNETNQAYYVPILVSFYKELNTPGGDLARKRIDSVANILITKQKQWIENYIHKNPSSEAGMYVYFEYYRLFEDIFHASPANMATMLEQMSGAAKNSVYYKKLASEVANVKNQQVNSVAPDFTLLKRDKTKFTLSSTRGKYILIDFCASWCVPCRAAIPNIKKAYAKYHAKGLNVVSVSNDRRWKDWTQALDKEKMPWIQVVDEFPSANTTAKVIDLYGVNYMPFYVLLDKQGKVLLASGDDEEVIKHIEGIIK